MKQLAVISGKGGTGKTSLAASLAQLACGGFGRVVAADCDVDAANLALLLPGEHRSSDPFVSGRRAVIDPELCNACGVCEQHCRFDAVQSHSVARIDPLECEGCGVCALVCPEHAVSFHDNQAGCLMESTTRLGPLIHARLGVAQDRSGKLVAAVRQRAREAGQREGLELIVIDAPPGIGCPVHAAVTGCDLALIVTEASPSGEHDLDRVLRLMEHFRIPVQVLINKFDLSLDCTARIEALASRAGVCVLGSLPFSRDVPLALARGELPLTVPELTPTLLDVWRAIAELLRAS